MNTKWNRKLVLLLVAMILSAVAVMATPKSQDGVWEQVDKTQLRQPGIDMTGLPNAYETFRLNRAALEAVLSRAPEEFSGGEPVILSLPMPDGRFGRFQIEHSLVVEKGLLEKFPELGATYRGFGIDDPTASVRFDLLPSGFHSMVLSSLGTMIVDPFMVGDTDTYIAYLKSDRPSVSDFKCSFGDTSIEKLFEPKKAPSLDSLTLPEAPEVTSGTQLRTYRLAVAGNFEYCAAASVGGNTVANCLAAQVLAMNRVNGVYEKDLAIRMNIVANNNLIVYAANNMTCPVPGGSMACTAANDPYSNGTADLNTNITVLDQVIGNANFDIGHVFTTGSGGVAGLGVVCNSAQKARGTTGLPSPVGDPFVIDFVAHEIGHQFGGNHTFNGGTGSCTGGNRSAANAYEVGSGITVMAYAGICGAQNLAPNSIDTFHVRSLEEIVAFSQSGGGNACAATTASGNTPPTVTGPGNFNIPRLTPFALTASATDPNGDAITYSWEEFDLGAVATEVPNTDAAGPKPIFRPYLPTTSGTRNFPSMQFILNNANVPPATTGGFLTGELMPQVGGRTMVFQVVARDNRAGAGGINTATSTLTVDANSGPFNVTAPNTAVSVGSGAPTTVTWSVNNTNVAPVNAANVRILLSTDGGTTFPTVLAASTANDGSETVTLPAVTSTTARIRVEAVGNIFFDISNVNFTITSGATSTPTATPTPSATPTATPCSGSAITTSYTGPAVLIPDNIPAGMNIPLAVSGVGTITDVNFRLDALAGCSTAIGDTNASMDHTFLADLSFRLTSPAGTTVNLILLRGGAGDNYCTVTLDDDGGFPAASTIPTTGAVTGNFAPESPLSAFDGQNANGNWILNVNDTAGIDTGSLRRFSLIITGAGACGTPTATPTLTATPTATPTAAPTATPIGGCAWNAAPVLPVPYLDQASVGVGSNLYQFSGVSNNAIVANANRFDGTAWSPIAPLPVALEFPQAVTDGTNAFIVGGSNAAGVSVNTLYRYNVATNTYTTLAPFTTATWNHAAVFLNGKIYKFGGSNNTVSTNALEIYDVATNTWTVGAPYPMTESFVSGFTQGGFIYGAGGISAPSNAETNKTYRYDPATNTWDDAAIADLPATRWGSATAFYNGGGVMAGGFSVGVIVNTVISWNPTTNTWGNLPNMLGERARMTGGILNGAFHVLGGRSIASNAFIGTNDNQRLFCSGATPTPTGTPAVTPTPTNTPTSTPTLAPTATPVCTPSSTWQAGPAQPPARYALQGALGSDNRFYIAGGQDAAATPVISNQFSRYDAATNTWANVANLPVAISQGTVGAAGGKVFVAGGFPGGTTVTNALRIYDIATNTWSSGANVPTAGAGVEAAAGAVVNGKFYVMGGDDFTNALNTTFIYDIASNTWTTGAPLPDLRTNGYATAAADGMIYLYGGLLGPGFTATDTLLRYNPVTNVWTNLGSVGTTARGNYGGISPLNANQLLITDGANTAFVATNTTHIFTISTGAFSNGPTMVGARAGHAQGTLADGRVIVAVGLNTASTVTSAVELLASTTCPTGTPTNTPTATPTLAPTATPTNTPTATPTPVTGEIIYGMTVANSNSLAGVNLVRFNSGTPGTVVTVGPFTGVVAGHAVRSIDFRPFSGQLYAISTNGTSAAQLYTVNLTTAALTPIGPGFTLGTNTSPIVEMDFNPVVDRVRIVTGGTGGMGQNNFRAHPDTGLLVAQDTNLAFDVSSPRAGSMQFNILGAAYTNNVFNATSTTLYAWDYFDDALVTIGGLLGAPSPNGGLMFTINTPGTFLTFNTALGMDISGATATMYVTHDDPVAGATMGLYTRNVTTGAQTFVGNYPAGTFVGDLSVEIAPRITPTPTATPTATPTNTPTATPTPQVTFVTFRPGNGPGGAFIDDESQSAAIIVDRSGITTGPSTINFTTTNGNAIGGAACGAAGVDYQTFTNFAVNFAAGELTRTVLVPLCSDLLLDANETVMLRLTGPDVQGAGTGSLIINDTANQFRNTASIDMNSGSPAIPYPAPITVTGVPLNGGMRVTLFDLNSLLPDNIDVLLVGPGGQKYVLMADSGGAIPVSANNPATLTFRDVQPQVLPNSTQLMTGVFEPTSWETPVNSFAAPAPPAPYVEPLSVSGGPVGTTMFGTFGLVTANGTWNLYVRDDGGLPVNPQALTGAFAGGWGLQFFSPTAAGVTVSGRVLTPNGNGLVNARVVLTDSRGVSRTVTTSSFGYYTFDDIIVGETYVIGVLSNLHTFQSQVIQVNENVADLDFIGIE